jgi:hypothetical protein
MCDVLEKEISVRRSNNASSVCFLPLYDGEEPESGLMQADFNVRHNALAC